MALTAIDFAVDWKEKFVAEIIKFLKINEVGFTFNNFRYLYTTSPLDIQWVIHDVFY
jgi:hypothetical protein